LYLSFDRVVICRFYRISYWLSAELGSRVRSFTCTAGTCTAKSLDWMGGNCVRPCVAADPAGRSTGVIIRLHTASIRGALGNVPPRLNNEYIGVALSTLAAAPCTPRPFGNSSHSFVQLYKKYFHSYPFHPIRGLYGA
jgi:hypothetical protein